MGVKIVENDDSVEVSVPDGLNATNIKTLPYPGIPTDMQPQFCVLMCVAQGTSKLVEGVFDNRFQYVGQLRNMGASIEVNGRVATISGGSPLYGAPVSALDLRAGAAMVIAGLAAQGRTEIENINYINRGYEDIVEKLSALGADISTINVDD
jgi:UDP-N-acetylglucosamine 1-carboxyvinyltransferase